MMRASKEVNSLEAIQQNYDQYTNLPFKLHQKLDLKRADETAGAPV